MGIFEFYRVALLEGEGIGTAYEYTVKKRILNRHCKKVAGRSLIYGLPERYGYSADLFLFLKSKGSRIDLYEKDNLKAARAHRILKDLDIRYRRIDKISGTYDIILSCEYFQSLERSEAISLWQMFRRISGTCIIFVPNGDNRRHIISSGLRGITGVYISKDYKGSRLIPLDMPPFPPGCKSDNRFRILLLFPLYVLSMIEDIVPQVFRTRHAHIYAIIHKG